METIWKTLDECDKYEISNNAEVRNKSTLKILKTGKSVKLHFNKKSNPFSMRKLMLKYYPQKKEHNNVLEYWVNVVNCENYQVSNLGEIKHKTNLNILSSTKNTEYCSISLINNNRSKTFQVHRLVAEAFIPNLENKPQVNHIDGNKHNNNKNNLEWCSASENAQHALNNNLKKLYKRSIIQIDLDGNIINTFESIREAKKNSSNVCKSLKNNCVNDGYLWKYVEPERPGRNKNDMKDLDGEIWKNYDNSIYDVSNMGRIKNNVTKNILKTRVKKNGREYANLSNLGKEYTVHRLVALAFILNDKDLPQVNHKDCNPLNNRLENLEWITAKDNMRYLFAKAVDQLDLNGNFIKRWDCMKDVKNELGVYGGNISRCCRNIYKTAGGFKWCYSNS